MSSESCIGTLPFGLAICMFGLSRAFGNSFSLAFVVCGFVKAFSNEQFETFSALDPRHASALSHVNRCGLVKRTGFSVWHSSCAGNLLSSH